MRDGFLKAIEQNPKDHATRNVYADWLEENDEPEEADRQRNWIAAYEWMEITASLCGDYCLDYGMNEPCNNWKPITVDMMIEAGQRWIDRQDYFVQIGSETARSVMGSRMSEYWKNWEIITGIKVPEEKKYDEYNTKMEHYDNIFSCSC